MCWIWPYVELWMISGAWKFQYSNLILFNNLYISTLERGHTGVNLCFMRVCVGVCLFFCLSVYLSAQSICLLINLSFSLSGIQPVSLSVFQSVSLSICQSIWMWVYLYVRSIFMWVFLSVSLPVYQSCCKSVYLFSLYLSCHSICLWIYLYVSLSVCQFIPISVYLCVSLSECQSICISLCLSVSLFVCESICLSMSVSVCLSVSLSLPCLQYLHSIIYSCIRLFFAGIMNNLYSREPYFCIPQGFSSP